MPFYHFTSKDHWEDIEEDGVIYTTESNVDMFKDHFGPDVVWLLDTSYAESGVHGLPDHKNRVRIEVDVPAIKWTDWMPAAAMSPTWRQAFIKSGGGDTAAARWYVWPAAIYRKHWVGVEEF